MADTDDKKLAELNAEIQKHSEAVNAFYNSQSFKAAQHELEVNAKAMQEMYNNPDWKKLQEEQAKLGAEFGKKWSDDDKLKIMTQSMGEAGRKIGVYFSSPAFKKMNEELENKYGIPHDRHYFDDRDENYKKYQDELESRLPPEIKQQTEKLKMMGEQMKFRYDSREFKDQSERLKLLSDSLSKAYASVNFKVNEADMKRLSEQMSKVQNNPQLKKELELLQQSVKKMTAYINSPEYRKHLEELMKFQKENSEWFDRRKKLDEPKPESPEKKEQPERKEQPEKQEQNN